MKRDPHIRDYHDRPPLVPGSLKRFRWPEPYDSEVRMLRQGVQEEARGLFLLRAPYDGAKLLVEAYYPEDMRDHYVARSLDPFRVEDYKMGRLVAIHIHNKIKFPGERLNSLHLDEIRRNNRNARRGLKRQAYAPYRTLELEDKRREDERPAFERWNQWFRQAQIDTKKFAMTPHVGPARNLALGG